MFPEYVLAYIFVKILAGPLKVILECLDSTEGDTFERGHDLLGKLIGYNSKNPGNSAAPDPYWMLGDELCIVAEDKLFESTDTPLSVTNIRQAASHETWVRKNIKTLKKDANIITIVISNSEFIEKSAITFADWLLFWSIKDFKEWAVKIIDVVRRLRKTFSVPGDMEWRSEAIKLFKEENMDPLSLIEQRSKQPLKMLQSK